MRKDPCNNISYGERDEFGIRYVTCKLAAEIKAWDSIKRYDELKERGCPDPDCIYSSGKSTKENASELSVV